jgi:prophage DNA circulation protein
VLGPAWELACDALINACEMDGPGLLVHPFHGTHRVVCETCSVSEGRAAGRSFASFNLAFVEAGDFQAPYYQSDPGSALLDQVGDGYGMMEGAFVG